MCSKHRVVFGMWSKYQIVFPGFVESASLSSLRFPLRTIISADVCSIKYPGCLEFIIQSFFSTWNQLFVYLPLGMSTTSMAIPDLEDSEVNVHLKQLLIVISDLLRPWKYSWMVRSKQSRAGLSCKNYKDRYINWWIFKIFIVISV